jgi:hypothetical protein
MHTLAVSTYLSKNQNLEIIKPAAIHNQERNLNRTNNGTGEKGQEQAIYVNEPPTLSCLS